jgi:anti-anti-sigma regulatory factor
MLSLPILPAFANIEASASLMARAFTHEEPPAGPGQRALLLDLSRVRVPTAGSLGRLVALHNRLRDSGGRLVLCNVGHSAFEVLELTRLTELLDLRRADGQGVGHPEGKRP